MLLSLALHIQTPPQAFNNVLFATYSTLSVVVLVKAYLQYIAKCSHFANAVTRFH